MMAALWSRLGKWLALAAGILLAIAGALAYGWRRGARAQADHDTVAAERSAHEAYTDANQAAAKIAEQAKRQPAPDVDKRNDFEGTD